MRGSDQTSELFSYVDLEARVPQSHPLRVIRGIVNEVLASLDAEFKRLYEGRGRESIANYSDTTGLDCTVNPALADACRGFGEL